MHRSAGGPIARLGKPDGLELLEKRMWREGILHAVLVWEVLHRRRRVLERRVVFHRRSRPSGDKAFVVLTHRVLPLLGQKMVDEQLGVVLVRRLLDDPYAPH